MSDRIYDEIRQILQSKPGLTQKGLAERMGLNPAAVNRMLYGRRSIKADEIPIIEKYLNAKLDISSAFSRDNVSVTDMVANILRQKQEPYAPQRVPVYDNDENVVDWVQRHPEQFGADNAFAVYVSSEDMEPRYFYGELAYVHKGRVPKVNSDCLVEMKDGSRYIRRLLDHNKEKYSFLQFNPHKKHDLDKSMIKAVYAIIGRG